MRWRRPSFLLVVAAGVLLGHELGYGVAALAGAATGLSHAYLDAALRIVPAAGAVALLAYATTTSRGGGDRLDLDAGRLLGAQVPLYVAIEVGERWLTGAPLGGLTEAPVIGGLLAQLAVALLFSVLVRLTMATLRGPLVTVAPTPPPAWRAGDWRDRVPAAHRPGSLGSRGPPLLAG
ncbi:MAG TPA: hypothetical protein VK906_08190 [Egicoccus sp.]|nr:hypothetical protein [Egicoccus sp.]HSK23139.1 hypothetical protein [Egicoccus sp.]